MEGEDLDGVAGSPGWARGWGCAALVVQDCGLGPGGLLVPSKDGEKNLLKQLKDSLGRPLPRAPGTALTWPGRQGADLSAVRRLPGMSDW